MNIVIFTNSEKLNQACVTDSQLESLGIIENNEDILNSQNPIISFVENKFQAFDNKSKIHLVFDGITELTQNVNLTLNKDSMVLWHINNPVETIKNEVQGITNNVRSSIHEGGWHYELVIKALLNETIIDKFEEVKKIIGIDIILEAKLELLHRCLLPSDAPSIEDFNKSFDVLKGFETAYNVFLDAKKSFKDEGTNVIYEASDADVFHPDYIEAVRQLRIALLGS